MNDIPKRGQKYLLVFLFLPALFPVFRNLDNDLWFLLGHGRYILEKGFPVMEPFTIHAGFDFVMQQWLSSVVFQWVYSVMGVWGIRGLVLFAQILSIALFWSLTRKISSNHFLSSFAVTLLYGLLMSFFMVARPYIFTSLIILLELSVLEHYVLDKRNSLLFLLPFLSLLLVNLQASMWPMLFIIMIPYLLDAGTFSYKGYQSTGYPVKPLWIVMAFMVLFGLINPYGLDAMLYLKNSYGIGAINRWVLEMQPLTASHLLGVFILLLLFVVISVHLYRKPSHFVLRYALLALGTGYLCLSSIRGLFFFLLCALFPLSLPLSSIELKPNERLSDVRTRTLRKVLVFSIVALVFLVLLRSLGSDEASYRRDQDLREMMQLLQEDQKDHEVVLYTGYADGNMALYYGIPHYIDARAEVFLYKNNGVEDVFMEYIDLQQGKLHYQEILEKYQFTHILVPENDLLYTYLPRDAKYRLYHSNEIYDLYEMTGEAY